MFEEPAYRWRDPEWRATAEAWIHEQASRAGRKVSGDIAGVRFLPWSAVMRAPTDGGNLYFKACGPSQRHEPALAAFLAGARPDCMIPVLAVDLARGWYLMPDGGETLTGMMRTPQDEFDHWSRVLSLQAGVQRDLITATGRLLSAGVLDRRPAVLSHLLADILSRPDHLLAGYPGGMSAADLSNLHAITPRLAEACLELSEIGPPSTFVHDDFHEDHIFTAQGPDGSWRYVFFDFGDACISHPFIQLVSQPRFAGNRFGVEVDPIQSRLREIYLAHWQEFAPPPDLERAQSLALIAGCIVRALTWVNACGGHLWELTPDLTHAYATRVAFWLRQIGERIDRLDAE